MNYVGKLLSNFKGFYNEINSATLTGAIDVVVIQHQDGSFTSSPFHVRFGKMGVLRSREKVVDIEVNGEPVDLHMKLGEAGEAFFVQEAASSSELPAYLATSPLPNTMELMEQGIRSLKYEARERGKQVPVSVQNEDFSKRLTDLPPAQICPAEEISTPDRTTLGTQTEIDSMLQNLEEVCCQLEKVDVERMVEQNDGLGVERLAEQNDTSGSKENMQREDSSLNSVGALPKKDSNQSLAYYSVHNSFDQPTPEEEQKTIDASGQSTGTEVATQTDLTGLEVETKAKVTLISTTVIPTVTFSRSTEVTTVTSDTSSELAKSPTSSSSIIKPKQSVSMDSIHEKSSEAAKKDSKDSLERRIVKRKRRKKVASQKSSGKIRHDSSSSAASSLLEVEHRDSGGSSIGEFPEEGLFDMDLSPDEADGDMLMSMARTVSMPIIDDKRSLSEEWAHSHFASNFHPFSDGDITPIVSPIGSRPPSPKSDTEYETNKTEMSSQTHLTGDDFQTLDDVKWEWGELPQSTSKKEELGRDAMEKEDEGKTPGGLFRFMRKTKKIRHQPEQEGIYLDDLNLEEMDPEVAALYLYNPKNASQMRAIIDEDNESGRGASLPQSPVSVEREPHTIHRPLAHKPNMGFPDISLSLCGGLKESEGEIAHDKFMQFLVTYDDFCQNPGILHDHNLVVRMGDKYYNWLIAGPIVMSLMAFQRPLPEHAIELLIKQHMPKKERRRGWIWWRTTDEPSTSKKLDHATSPPSSTPSSGPNSPQKNKERRRNDTTESSSKESDISASHKSTQTVLVGRKGKLQDSGSSGDESDTSIRTGRITEELSIDIPEDYLESHPEKYKKSLKLTSDQLAKLNLRDGPNEVAYSVTTQFQGTSKCTCYIYLWKWDDRIIVSDIDGTITKSDVLGQVLPMIGKDWSQAGIANLYRITHQNGYKFLYLSARAIGQSKITRDYLRSVRQGDVALPAGPLLLSPSSLISAFHREVIERKPEEFKISCLRDIIALFPKTRNPLYAGYGNKINDVWAYRAVGIPISRIFTVNHRGEIRMEQSNTFQTSYSKLTDIVDHFFPPLVDKQLLGKNQNASPGKVPSGNFPAADEYSTFTYWRQPLPDIQIDLDQFKKSGAVKGSNATEEEKS